MSSPPGPPVPAFQLHPQLPSPLLPFTGWGQGLLGPQPRPQQEQQTQPPGPPLHDGCGSATRECQVPPANRGTVCSPCPPARGNQSPGLRRGHSRSWSTPTARRSCSQLTGAALAPPTFSFPPLLFLSLNWFLLLRLFPRGGVRVGSWGEIWPHICDPDAGPFRGPEATTSGGYHFL